VFPRPVLSVIMVDVRNDNSLIYVHIHIYTCQSPLWSSGQSSWEQAGVRFPALPDFMRSSASGTETTQPRENN
jgi:hypothetical protein